MKMAVHDHLSELLKQLAASVKPGVKLQSFYDQVDEYHKKYPHLRNINKGYSDERNIPYPRNMCININSAIAHGIPVPDYELQDNDLIGFDIGIQDKDTKECADAGLTVGVGEIKEFNAKLLKVTKEACYQGIDQIKAGANILEISKAIESYVTRHHYVPSRRFCSHRIGKVMHMPPSIPSYVPQIDPQAVMPDQYIMKEGWILCIEPIITSYDFLGVHLGDGWTYRTKDGRNSCMFEHMVKVTKTGHEVLTTHIQRD